MAEVGVNRSNLHLKKELTAIRKAARVLRDPGTTSSWRSPLPSSNGANRASAVPATLGLPSSSTWNHYGSHSHTQSHSRSHLVENIGREKKVFLYNWRSNSNQRSFSDKSGAKSDECQNRGGLDGSSSPDGSLSDARNGNGDADSKSDTYLDDHRHQQRQPSMIFGCRDTKLAPSATPPLSVRRTTTTAKVVKKKVKKNSSAFLRQKQRALMLGSGNKAFNSKRALEGVPSIGSGLSADDSMSLVEHSDGTEDYCNSEDLRQFSGASPLLPKLRHRNWSYSSTKLLGTSRKEDSSYTYSTPALSTNSFNRYDIRNPSTVGSWDGTTTSFNDGDDEIDDHLDFAGRQRCGIPCYWSKRSTPKHRGACGSCCSPSFSDTLRRKGSSILCGSQTMYRTSRRHRFSPGLNKRVASRTVKGLLPLLTDSCDGTGRSDDELSTNYGELDLEALSRLDGRRWSSSCRSQEGLELVPLSGEGEEEGTPENIRSLSHKYRPMFFDELIGQNIVVQSLMNAISRRRIAHVYLFQGPRGTGKTSMARVFAAALNCVATEGTKPCGFCRECMDFISGKSSDIIEVDATNKKGIDRVRYILKYLLLGATTADPRYKIFVVDECHLLPAKTWLAFLKFLEEPPRRVLFIFITTDLDNVPRTILSRCQKYIFNKIKDDDIVTRLRKISADENLDVESDALDLIALNADGSLRDAETMLEQLSLLGKKITTSFVNELIGIVPDEKLLELLELAMSSDTAETVKRARELLDSGVDAVVLMSQLASLIMDIIAGNYHIVDSKYNDSVFGGRGLSEAELDRLKHALKLLSEAEKQLRVSTERATWFTATLLQLGSVPSPDQTQSGSSRKQSSKASDEDLSSAHYVTQKMNSTFFPRKANGNSNLAVIQHINNHSSSANSHDNLMVGIRCVNPEKLDAIWGQCIERCHSETLRQLLCTYGKLVSVSEVEEGVLVAYIAFSDENIKSRVERFVSSITNSMELVLRRNIEVRIILLPDNETCLSSRKPVESASGSLDQRYLATTVAIKRERKAVCSNIVDPYSRGSFNNSEGKMKGEMTVQLTEGGSEINGENEGKPALPMQRIEAIIREQRLETAWLQTAEKGPPGSVSRLKPEKNQVLPQDEIYHQDQVISSNQTGGAFQHWEDDVDQLNNEIKVVKLNDAGRPVLQMDQIGKKVDHYPMSPSLLHDSSFVGNFSKDNLGYESGSGAGGCNGLFCWNKNKPPKRGKVQKGTSVQSNRRGRFLWFGECGKPKNTESRLQR